MLLENSIEWALFSGDNYVLIRLGLLSPSILSIVSNALHNAPFLWKEYIMTDTNVETVGVENDEIKRGRKPLTFAEIVATEPTEIESARSAFMAEVFNVSVDPHICQLLSMASVRNMFYASELYREANKARAARIDAQKRELELKAKVREANKKDKELMAAVAAIDPAELRAFLAARQAK